MEPLESSEALHACFSLASFSPFGVCAWSSCQLSRVASGPSTPASQRFLERREILDASDAVCTGR